MPSEVLYSGQPVPAENTVLIPNPGEVLLASLQTEAQKHLEEVFEILVPPTSPPIFASELNFNEVVATTLQISAKPIGPKRDSALIRALMNGLIYEVPLRKILEAHPTVQMYVGNKFIPVIEIHPFLHMYDPLDRNVKGNCVELSFHFVERANKLSIDGGLSEKHSFAIVRGRCPHYFSDPNMEHVFVLGWADKHNEIAKAYLESINNKPPPLLPKEITIYDPSFHSIVKEKNKAEYLIDALVQNGSELNIQRKYFLRLHFNYADSIETTIAPLGFAYKLLKIPDPTDLDKIGLNRKSMIYIGFVRDFNGKHFEYKLNLSIQKTPLEKICAWPEHTEILSSLSNRNLLKRFARRVEAQLKFRNPVLDIYGVPLQ